MGHFFETMKEDPKRLITRRPLKVRGKTIIKVGQVKERINKDGTGEEKNSKDGTGERI